MPDDDVTLTTYERAPQLPGILLGRLGVFHGSLVLGSSLLVVPRDDARWDGTRLRLGGEVFVLGDTVSAGGGQTTVGRLKQVATPEGWPDNAGAVVVRRPVEVPAR